MKCIKLYLNDAHHTEWLAARCKTYMARLVHHPETHEYKVLKANLISISMHGNLSQRSLSAVKLQLSCAAVNLQSCSNKPLHYAVFAEAT